jgi:hypothetical protein
MTYELAKQLKVADRIYGDYIAELRKEELIK